MYFCIYFYNGTRALFLQVVHNYACLLLLRFTLKQHYKLLYILRVNTQVYCCLHDIPIYKKYNSLLQSQIILWTLVICTTMSLDKLISSTYTFFTLFIIVYHCKSLFKNKIKSLLVLRFACT